MSKPPELNPQQKEAVLHTEGPLLIVAGAGAGKTKTITHRIAHLIEKGVPAYKILAVTFTNKAAGEMRERVRSLVPAANGMPLVCTFHALGVRLLREFHTEAKLPRGFVIWDRDDSIRAIKAALEKLDSKQWAPRSMLSAISRQKGDGVDVHMYAQNAKTYREKTVSRVWEEYERGLLTDGALDFDDLLLHTLALLRTSERVRSLLQNRWSHITIDEYQDTNKSQYEIARILAGEKKNICVVGDTDQCLVAGTRITMADGTKKAIEAVRVGDMVLSSHGSGDFRPTQVAKVFSRKFSGDMVRITTKNGRTLISTPEHIHFAGYRLGATPQMYFTYLMHKRGKGFRLGVSQVYTKGQRAPMVGFQQRCNQEHADNVWIVGTHTTPNDARVLEYLLSLQYGIPTLPFVARKGTSKNGYVHDQKTLDSIFGFIDSEKNGTRLLKERGLMRAYPHHRAQATKERRNIVVTLCGDHRGKVPMHRISVAASDPASRRALESIGLSVRTARADSQAWRFETAHKNYGELRTRVEHIRSVLPDAVVVEMARLGGRKKNPRDGNSLPFMPAASVLPGMATFDERGGYDIVESVERVSCDADNVYDINVEHAHNFIANGIITHNSIYSWRGADIEHLLGFEASFPGARVIVLEQNYRSTRTILAAANSIIEKNLRRRPKHLFTDNPTGEPIALYPAQNEIDEAWFVAQIAQEAIGRGVSAGEIAVLYRENFQSRALEEAMLHFGIPYRVLGTKFFERREVKDVLSYLRAAMNPKSGNDISRVVSVPPRGIGKVTVEKMLRGEDASLPAATRAKVAAFRDTLARIKHAIDTLPTAEAVRYAVETSGMEKMYKAKRSAQSDDEAHERLENIHELVNLATKYDHELPPTGVERLLEEAALQSDQDELPEEKSAVSLMTVHASKGLEFDAVFVTGLEQGLFPSLREGESADRDPEEERRLLYVALTRARKQLFLTYASARMKYGSRDYTLPSEFLDDIDQRLLTTINLSGGTEKEEEIQI